jgi:hypothetical protein
MEKQVEKTAYRFEKYCGPDRWASFYFQLKETFALKPKKVLEIGVGNNTFRNGITADTGILYESLDIAEDLHPTHIGSVDKMPLADKSFDVVCAFEILEHLPFEKFEKSIGEIARVSRKHAVISLPHFGPPVRNFSSSRKNLFPSSISTTTFLCWKRSNNASKHVRPKKY